MHHNLEKERERERGSERYLEKERKKQGIDIDRERERERDKCTLFLEILEMRMKHLYKKIEYSKSIYGKEKECRRRCQYIYSLLNIH